MNSEPHSFTRMIMKAPIMKGHIRKMTTNRLSFYHNKFVCKNFEVWV